MAAGQGDALDPEAARILARFREIRSDEWLACEILIAVRGWAGAGREAVPLDKVFAWFWPVFDAFPSMSSASFLGALQKCGLVRYAPAAEGDELRYALDDAAVAFVQSRPSGVEVVDTGLAQSLKNVVGFSLTGTRDANVPGAEVYLSGLPEAANASTADIAILMPFKDQRRAVFEKALRPAAEQAGLSCMRADEFYGSKHIVSEIFSLIKNARLVVSDISGLNPNVMYETGIAHAIGRPVLLIAERGTKVPFDVQHLRRIEYARGGAGLAKLAVMLRSAFADVKPR
jgi:hypothetical protein